MSHGRSVTYNQTDVPCCKGARALSRGLATRKKSFSAAGFRASALRNGRNVQLSWTADDQLPMIESLCRRHTASMTLLWMSFFYRASVYFLFTRFVRQASLVCQCQKSYFWSIAVCGRNYFLDVRKCCCEMMFALLLSVCVRGVRELEQVLLGRKNSFGWLLFKRNARLKNNFTEYFRWNKVLVLLRAVIVARNEFGQKVMLCWIRSHNHKGWMEHNNKLTS